MEIFNIHIFEFLLIAGLALVVFGPERLPEVGRFVGKQVARFLAWQQQSPELKMITDVRSEFEREIASLRDELVRTRNQLDITQDAELKSLRDELRPMLNLRDAQAQKPGSAGPLAQAETSAAKLPRTWDPPAEDELPLEDALEDTPEGAETALADATEEGAETVAELIEATPAGPPGTVPAAARPNRLAATAPTNVLDKPDERLAYLSARRGTLHDAPPPDDGPPATPALNGLAWPPDEAALSPDDAHLLMRRLETLSADVQALISDLQARGLIGHDWELEAAVDEQEGLTR